MAYRDLKMKDLGVKFGIQEIGTKLFDVSKIKKITPSDKLLSDLADAEYITLSTEKAVSERLVSPVLVEIAKLNEDLQIFSGEIIVADKANGLNGELDFIFARKPWTRKPKNPLLCVTESKLGLINSGSFKLFKSSFSFAFAFVNKTSRSITSSINNFFVSINLVVIFNQIRIIY